MARISLYLNDGLLAQIDREAKVEGTSRSGLVQKAVIQYFEAKRKAREEEEKRKMMREASRKLDELAKKLGNWDAISIVRKFRDSNLQGGKCPAL